GVVASRRHVSPVPLGRQLRPSGGHAGGGLVPVWTSLPRTRTAPGGGRAIPDGFLPLLRGIAWGWRAAGREPHGSPGPHRLEVGDDFAVAAVGEQPERPRVDRHLQRLQTAVGHAKLANVRMVTAEQPATILGRTGQRIRLAGPARR